MHLRSVRPRRAAPVTALLLTAALTLGGGVAALPAAASPAENTAETAASAPVFRDVPAGAQFAKEIAWMKDKKISTGYPNGTYRPLDNVNRDAMAAFLHRLVGSWAIPPHTGKWPFKDVAPAQQFSDEMRWVHNFNISRGWPDGTYRPLTPVNRDAMAAFLFRLTGSPDYTPPKKSPFTDVSTDNQFYKEISWLAAEGISTGWVQPDGTRTFAPTAPVKRDAMAAFMYRFAERGYGMVPGTIRP